MTRDETPAWQTPLRATIHVYPATTTDITEDAADLNRYYSKRSHTSRHGEGEPICARCGDDNWVHLMAIIENRDLGFEADDDECINCYDCSAREAADDL